MGTVGYSRAVSSAAASHAAGSCAVAAVNAVGSAPSAIAGRKVAHGRSCRQNQESTKPANKQTEPEKTKKHTKKHSDEARTRNKQTTMNKHKKTERTERADP